MRSLLRYAILPGMLFPALTWAFTPISLSPGWNLVANSDPSPMDVAARLSGSPITTVWKWNKQTGKWAFFAPSMNSAQLATYAQNKGYDVLSTLDSKDGFWVNASAATVISDPLASPPAVGSMATLAPTDFAQGWNLMGSADKKSPSQLSASLFSGLNAAGKAISTVWAWDTISSNWRFFAPSLEAQGGTALSSYIAGKNYLPFTGVLAQTDGFWVNVGAATPIVNPPSANLRALTFTSPSDWSLRVFSGTAAQNTPATDGSTRYRELRTARVAGGAPYSWTTGSEPRRNADLHWEGSHWVNCPINTENTTSAVDANGNTVYNYCKGLETGSSLGNTTTTVDVSGRPMIDVYNEVLAAGYETLSIASAVSVLSTAMFPAGSKLSYRNNSNNYSPSVAYYPGTGNWATLADAAAASGNSTACNANPFPGSSPTATLEQLVAVNRGTPCVYGVNNVTGLNGLALSSGARNEGWGSTTLSLGAVGSAPTYSNASSASSWYTSNTRLRVAFGSGNVAKYYSCQESWNGSPRNCNLSGTGTYVIQTVGDARTMVFAGLPTEADALNYARVLVERGGYVYYGYQSTPLPSKSARLNLTGLNALFGILGLPAFSPDVPVVLSLGSYSGSYSGIFSGSDTGTFSISISSSGGTTCSGISVAGGSYTCTFTLTPSASDSTQANISMGITGTGAVFTGTADFYTGAVKGAWVNGAASGTFSGSRQ